MAQLDRSHKSSYWRSIVTITLSCIVSEVKRNIGGKSRFFHTAPAQLHSTPPLAGPRMNTAVRIGLEKLEWCGYSTVRKALGYDYSF